MTSRKAHQLARLLDGQDPAPDLGGLAHLARALAVPAPQARPEFRDALRQELIAAARAQAAHPPLLARMRSAATERIAKWRYSVGVASATGVAAMSLASGGVAAAAERSLPGDPFYPVKLVIEDVRLRFTAAPASAAELERTAERVREAREALREGNDAAAMRALESAASSASAAADAAADPGAGPLPALDPELRATLDDVAAGADPATSEAAQDVLDTIDALPVAPPTAAAPTPAPADTLPVLPVPTAPSVVAPTQVPTLPATAPSQPSAPAPSAQPLPEATTAVSDPPAPVVDGVLDAVGQAAPGVLP